MDDFKLLIDLHQGGKRQGPGGDAETELAMHLARLGSDTPLQIADIGCGTGASALFLAKHLNAQITAVDFLQTFLDVLNQRAKAEGVADKISTLACSMDELPFANETFDVLWSEGAIYNIGFTQGIGKWRPFLKPGGVLVVSEITWLTDSRPSELQAHWDREYPEINVASAKIKAMEGQGYTPMAYFTLPEHCWLDHYYRPLQSRFADFLNQNNYSEEAQAVVEAEQTEIALYENYKSYYSYGVYIAIKL